MDKLTMAKYFATQEHVTKRGQRYGVLPYTHHLERVDTVLVTYLAAAGLAPDVELRCAAWLHDVLEDCDGIKSKDLREMFGERVTGLVAAVTNEPGENRAARHARTYPKIRETPDAILVKLADRIANVSQGGALVAMYQKEQDTFERMLCGSAVSCTEYAELQTLLWKDLATVLGNRVAVR